jgi:hypothetical protein
VTIYKSRVVNTDPFPWRDYAGDRHQGPVARQLADVFDPRPEFDATRDPMPWALSISGNDAGRSATHDRHFRWAPRPEFDNPVNPILDTVRKGKITPADILWAITRGADHPNDKRSKVFRAVAQRGFVQVKPYDGEWIVTGAAARRRGELGGVEDQIDHARKVLQRLANWSAS